MLTRSATARCVSAESIASCASAERRRRIASTSSRFIARFTARTPDGTVVPLVWIDDWDFHWQGNYTFVQPIPLPGGTRIDMTAVFDNSAENRRQPTRPPRPVSWGEGTTDEMAIVFLGVTVDNERIGWQPR